MKFNLLIFSGIICLLSTSLSAQEWRLGVQLGAASTSGGTLVQSDLRPVAEINTERTFGKRFSAQIGIRYAETPFGFRFGSFFLPRGIVIDEMVTMRHVLVPFSVRYRILELNLLSRRFTWKGGVGLAPDFMLKRSSASSGFVASLNVFDLDYMMSESLSVGLDYDFQKYITHSNFLIDGNQRHSFFLTTSYKIGE